MNTKKDNPVASEPRSGALLRRPVPIVKKRSGPLDEALAAVGHDSSSDAFTFLDEHNPNKMSEVESVKVITAPTTEKATSSTQSGSDHFTAAAPQHSTRRRPSHFVKDKERKRERWLLTRKTWKYMTDAGRKLIPDGALNRKEDIPKIEANFQQVCSAEPRFILWRRKSSYPGAMRNSKRRLRKLLQHTGQQKQGAMPLTLDQIEQEEASNVDHTIELLHSYLKLDECFKTTTLLGSKTVRPDQTASPSAQRPANTHHSAMNRLSKGLHFFGTKDPSNQMDEIEQLLERLRVLQRSATSPAVAISPEMITHDILKDKALLKQIYNSLKKQQLHRVLGKHSSSHNTSSSLGTSNLLTGRSTSLLSLFHLGGSHSSQGASNEPKFNKTDRKNRLSENVENPSAVRTTTASPKDFNSQLGNITKTKNFPHTRRSPPKSLDLTKKRDASIVQSKKKTVAPSPKQFNTCGTQTNFIPLQEIKRLSEEYKERQREEAAIAAGADCLSPNTDEESNKLSSSKQGSHQMSSSWGLGRRKSSIDNEDVSQSVSDTIKRYLRMARKKSVHEGDAANRFKRVNYDRNLRNIRAKGEINPPGMDEGNSKAVQTLDAWPLIQLDFIRGNENSGILEHAHEEWQKALDERIQKKLEYEQKMKNAGGGGYETDGHMKKASSCSSSSAPTSPTSPLSTSSEPTAGTQIKSPIATSLYQHGSGNTGSSPSSILHTSSQFFSNLWHGGQQSDSHSPNKSSTSLNVNAGDSKSSMQKSKSSSNVGQFVSRKILRSRSKSQTRPSSSPAIANFNYSKWAPTDKHTWISENGERLLLTDAPLQNLSEIESKFLQRVAMEKISELNIGISIKLDNKNKSQKRRVLPKKKAMTTSLFDIGKKDEQSNCFGVFGNSLECCIDNDRKCDQLLNGSTKERGSRTSIASIFRVGGESVRSCESLPTSTSAENIAKAANLSMTKSSSMHLSSSQWDVRRKSQDYVSSTSAEFHNLKGFYEDQRQELRVPMFINACIHYLERNGLHSVGLFRVSTSKKRVKQMREEFNKCNIKEIGSDTCPHDVATLLKEFLRDLPQPLLCENLYKAFLQTQKIRNRRLQLEAISHLIKLLPIVHRDTLYVLLRFLARVAAHCDDVLNPDGSLQMSGNKMDSNNLATVFAPNILRTNLLDSSLSSMTDSSGVTAAAEQESMSNTINVIRIMIDHYEELFRVPAELIDNVYAYMLDECPEQLYNLCELRNAITRNDGSSSASPLSSPDHLSLEQQQPKPQVRGEKFVGKKLYSRQSVMHDNDASLSNDEGAFPAGKEALGRYFEPKASRIERSDPMRDLSIDRRQSSPNVLSEANVVSGSLQISMPKQRGNLSVFNRPYANTSSAEGASFNREAPNVQNDELDQPISALLSIQTKAENKSTAQFIRDPEPLANKKEINAKAKQSREPKLPASISNIGGAILKSKTADFERMSAATRNISMAKGESKASPGLNAIQQPATGQQPQQHLYKRQELISSSKAKSSRK